MGGGGSDDIHAYIKTDRQASRDGYRHAKGADRNGTKRGRGEVGPTPYTLKFN